MVSIRSGPWYNHDWIFGQGMSDVHEVLMNLQLESRFDSSVNNSEIPNRVFHLIRSTFVAQLKFRNMRLRPRTHQKLQNQVQVPTNSMHN